MNIRIAAIKDFEEVQKVHLSAFPEDEGEIVSRLAVDLLSEKTTPPTISLVAEADETIAGHIAFSPVFLENYKNFQGYILAPLAVKPEYQKHRIGSQLIEHGIQQLSAMGANVIFVYGDPGYYGRFGFRVVAAAPYTTPYRLQYPSGWQALVINECEIGNAPVSITCVPPLHDPRYW